MGDVLKKKYWLVPLTYLHITKRFTQTENFVNHVQRYGHFKHSEFPLCYKSIIEIPKLMRLNQLEKKVSNPKTFNKNND